MEAVRGRHAVERTSPTVMVLAAARSTKKALRRGVWRAMTSGETWCVMDVMGRMGQGAVTAGMRVMVMNRREQGLGNAPRQL